MAPSGPNGASPQPLDQSRADLDRAVWDAYGWDDLDPAAVEEDAN